MTTTHSPWTGTVTVEDTALAVTDTGGPGRPVVYLNGCYADQSHWRRVTADLGAGFRHITFDARARGKSQRSADYSFEACLRDIDAVLAARAVERPILVGWSYGAVLAVNWAARNPGRAEGVVCVDGALPHEWLDDAARAKIRKLFRRLSPLFPVARRLGMAARMSAAQHAEVNIEANELCAPAVLNPVLDSLALPVHYVLATGGNLGGEAQLMERIRADLTPATLRNPNIRITAKAPSNHSKILRQDHHTIAHTIRELTAPTRSAEAA
ncbi:Haloalkane dehalogenase (plasmid) [Streptomyces sp. enrichment culture]|uniref:alpha/beta fold hydrolase n=1 Tax=Streptomyces sp. enrichment culture TaxID=1795815 RepID=UPI003F57A2D9